MFFLRTNVNSREREAVTVGISTVRAHGITAQTGEKLEITGNRARRYIMVASQPLEKSGNFRPIRVQSTLNTP